ncbi:MAG TPA: NUDIX domain-containing protein [Gaiellaceae bacterium]|jgi:dATP pyrophosphohydrolase|nr:NUDIX domain-containing protein [Gaiellaceae bacterium]
MRAREVMVVVRRGADFLVLHRAPQFDAYWHLVAGGVERGESPRDAAVRELHEEVGLDLTAGLHDLGRPFVYSLAEESPSVRARFDPEQRDVPVDVFVAEVDSQWEPALNEEHDAYRWCTRDEAVALLHWPEPREIVGGL